MAGGNFAATLWKIPGNHFYVVGQQQGRQFDVCRIFFFHSRWEIIPGNAWGFFPEAIHQDGQQGYLRTQATFSGAPEVAHVEPLFFSPRRANPAAYSTWMDEDYLKKMGKVLNVVNYKTAPKRVLQRWALSLPEHLKVTLGDWAQLVLETLGKMNCILRSLSCETQCFHAVFSHVYRTNNK